MTSVHLASRLILAALVVMGFGGQMYFYVSDNMAVRPRLLPIWAGLLNAGVYVLALLYGVSGFSRVLLAALLTLNAWAMARSIQFCPVCRRMHTSLGALIDRAPECRHHKL